MTVLDKIRLETTKTPEHPRMRLSGESAPHGPLEETTKDIRRESLRERFLSIRRPINYSELVLKQFSLLANMLTAVARGQATQEDLQQCQKELDLLRKKEGEQVAALLENRRALKSGEGDWMLSKADELLKKYERKSPG